MHVQQDQVGPQRARLGHAAGPVGRDVQGQVGAARHQLGNDERVDGVVLDVEHVVLRQWGDRRSRAVQRARDRWRRLVGRHGPSGGRQQQFEDTAFALAAAHLHCAAHAFDQGLDDGQADARALDGAAVGAQAVEGLEEL